MPDLQGVGLDDLRDAVSRAADVPLAQVDLDSDLVGLGLDSIRLMRLAGWLRKQGLPVRFAELSSRKTVGEWWRLVQEAQAARPPRQPDSRRRVVTVDEDQPFDLAVMQHAFWVGRVEGQQLSGVSAHFYNEFDADGDSVAGVDPRRLECAVLALFQRHGMLRMRMTDTGQQRIDPRPAWSRLQVHDLRGLASSQAQARLGEVRDRLSHQTMDVATGHVFDVQLSLLDGGATRMHVSLDMMAADAMSLRTLLADLVSLYDGATLPALGYSYPRYRAERAAVRQAARDDAAAWWRERVPGMPGAPALPVVHEDPSVTAPTVTRRHHWLSPERKATLAQVAHHHGLTPAAALSTVFAEVIARWSASDRFLLNLPVFDREPLHDDIDAIVGDFSSSVLLDTDMSGDVSFVERAAAVQESLREALGHTEYTGVEVLRDLTRAAGGEPVLAPVVFTSALDLGELFAPQVQERFGRPSWIISQGPQVWLDAQVTELDGGILTNWDARDSVFPTGVLDAMFEAYTGLIDRLLDDERAWSQPVEITLPASQQAVRDQVNATDRPGRQGLLYERFFALAASDPDRTAVVADDGTTTRRLTHGQLSTAARQVAEMLRAERVGPGSRVGITMHKGPDQIVAVLGVLAAGAAYVPSGLDVPMRRRTHVFESAGATVVLTDAETVRDEWPASTTVLTVAQAAGHTPVEDIVVADPESEMYVLFTSGSTGEPKGVQVPHRAVANTIDAVRDVFDIDASDRTIALSALDFDLSVYDMFAFLGFGGSLVAVHEPQRRDAHAWARLIRDHHVTVVSCVPALLDMLITAGADHLPGSDLRLVMLGGDWVTVDLPPRLRALVPGCRFAGLGGMTEAAIHSTVFEVDQVDPGWRAVPYGTPLANMRCRVADPRGRDCPDWVPGELWVAGAGVALGYDGDPERTADKFVHHASHRWYRTGDLARYWPDGTLEFLGRGDSQVKIRGHRIELGDIEAQLSQHPQVHRAVAWVVGGTTRRLTAAVVLDDPTAADGLHDWLSERVPRYMVPEQIHVADAFPITSNGKIDRAAIRAQLSTADLPTGAYDAPAGAVEQTVAALWCELLDVPRVGRGDGFFALGGDSLLATRLMNRLREANLRGAALSALFTTPTLAEFAATLSSEAGEAPARRSALVPRPEERFDPFPLTDVQRAYWIGRDPKLPLGGISPCFYLELDGKVDLPRLEETWNRLVQRHDMLRAVVTDDGVQRVLPDVPAYRIDVVDTDGDETFDAAVAAMRDDLAHGQAEASTWPLFQIRAVRRTDAAGQPHHRLGVVLDSIVLDGRSIMVLFTEWDLLYRDPEAPLPGLGVSFRDYVTQTRPDPDQEAACLEYWRSRVPDLPPAPALPTVVDPAALERPRFSRYRTVVPTPRWERLVERARRHDLTPTAVLLTAYAQVLAQWSGQDHMTVNLTLFDRDEVHPDVDRVVGDFSSLLLVECRTGGHERFVDVARTVQQQLWRDLDHRQVSGVRVLRELARHHQTAVQAMPVVFTSVLGVGDDASLDFSPTFPQAVAGLTQTPQVWLDLKVSQTAQGLAVDWDAVDDLFAEGMAQAMFDAYAQLVERLVDSEWDEPLGSTAPRSQLAVRERVNATVGPEPENTVGGGLLHGAFFARAAEAPGRTALVYGGSETTYAQLATQALQVAAWLTAHGVEPGQTVGVEIPKSPEQVAALLGVLAAGATYLPIGADLPSQRKQTLATNGNAALVITDLAPALRVRPAQAPVQPDPSQIAYVIFTSGSTGEPKGVEITHRAAANTVDDISTRYGVGPDDRVLAVSAAEFDLSVYDIFGLLGAGGSLVLVAEDERRDAQRWLSLVHQHRVTVWNTVPALLEMLVTVAETETGLPDCLRLAMVSGDWVPVDLPRRVHAMAPGCRFVAMGGATEASIWSNAFEVTDLPPGWPSVPYGYPLRNQRFRVADPHGRDCPDWVPGELWIGGTGVAVGYRGDPERTADKFVEHDGERWYRTGDLGRYWPDGTLEFLGRADTQVKVRGHRIELGEIEAAFASHPDVARVVCVAPGMRERRRLVAYVQGGCSIDDLRQHVAQHLPGYAVPRTIVAVDSFPMTSNGKIDRAALTRRAAGTTADSASTRGGGAYRAPKGPLEEKVAALWSELLGVERVGRDDEFFALGGDSLLAARLVSRLRADGVAGAGLANLFLAPSLEGFSATLAAGTAAPAAAAAVVADPDGRYEPFPLTDVQQAYWIGRDPGLPLGGVAAQFYVEYEETDLDVPRLAEAWNRLVARHDMLRAVVDADGRQRVVEQVPRYTIAVVDAGDAFDERLAQTRDRAALSTPDVSTWPLFTITVVRGAGGRCRLCVVLDTIVVDGLSILTLFAEWQQLYADPAAALPSVGVSFRDYLLQSHPEPASLDRARAYWRDRLPSLPPAPRLPLRRDPRTLGRPSFSRREAVLDSPTWSTITSRAGQHGITPAVVLLTCYCDVLGRWSGQGELTVNLTLFDRQPVHPDIDRVVGDFTSLLLTAYRSRPGDSWVARARRLHEQLWRDMDHREVSGVSVLRDLAREYDVPVGAMPVVFTSMIGVGTDVVAATRWPDLTRSQTAQVWLDHQVVERPDGLLLSWDSVDDLFGEGLVDSMFAEYLEDLRRLAVDDWGTAPGVSAAGAPALVAPARPQARHEPGAQPSFEAPRGRLEETVAALWAELLGVDRVGRGDRFFALGGDSLLATRLVARLRTAGITGGRLVVLLAGPSLAEFVETLSDGGTSDTVTIQPDPEHRHDPFPLTQVQEAYWIGRRGDFDLGGVPSLFGTEREIPAQDIPRLEESWNRLVQRHDMLRAVVTPDGQQMILDEVPYYRIPLVSLDPGPAGDQELAGLREQMRRSTTDCSVWPLFDIRVVERDRTCHLVVVLDTMIVDGSSMLTLFTEWDRLVADPGTELEPVRLSFRDYVEQSHPDPERLAQAEQYWRDRVPTLPPGPRLPTQVAPGEVERPSFERCEHHLGAQDWTRILDQARQHGLTPSVVLLACYTEVLAAWADQAELTVNLTLFDRPPVHPDVDRVVGDFTSLVLVAHRLQADDTWLGRAHRLHEQVWRDLDHREMSGVRVLRELARHDARLAEAVPVVFTSMLGVDDAVARQVRWPDRAWSQTSQVWLDHQAVELVDGVLLTWDYVDGLFPDGTVEDMFDAYVSTVRALVHTDWAVMPAWMPSAGAVGPTEPAPTSAAPSDVATEGLLTDLEHELAGLWRDVLGQAPPGRSDNFFASGGDSLAGTRLVQAAITQYGVEVSLREFFRSPTIAALAETIDRQLAADESTVTGTI